MRIVTLLLIGTVLALAGLIVYVRLAPTDPAAWHVDPAAGQSGPGAAVADVTLPGAPGEVLARLEAVALATARTRRLAGSVGEGRITFVTRSAVFGFPDYTTISAEPAPDGQGTRLRIFARLRFGQADFGVNAARVSAWLDALGAG